MIASKSSGRARTVTWCPARPFFMMDRRRVDLERAGLEQPLVRVGEDLRRRVVDVELDDEDVGRVCAPRACVAAPSPEEHRAATLGRSGKSRVARAVADAAISVIAGGPPQASAIDVRIAAPVGVRRSPSASMPESGTPQQEHARRRARDRVEPVRAAHGSRARRQRGDDDPRPAPSRARAHAGADDVDDRVGGSGLVQVHLLGRRSRARAPPPRPAGGRCASARSRIAGVELPRADDALGSSREVALRGPLRARSPHVVVMRSPAPAQAHATRDGSPRVARGASRTPSGKPATARRTAASGTPRSTSAPRIMSPLAPAVASIQSVRFAAFMPARPIAARRSPRDAGGTLPAGPRETLAREPR